ncbi:MAG TPA: PqiC family protein [Rhodanobacteraceae bacterium]
MSRLFQCLGVAGATLALAACASAPTQFFTLVPPPATGVAAPAAYAIAVVPVTIPAQVDRPQMVVREGDTQVTPLEGERWIAPLGDEIRNALSADLTRQLGAQDVHAMAYPQGVPVYRISVAVTRFESVPGRYTALTATWDVRALDGKKTVVSCTTRERQNVAAGYAALAAGHQRGLQSLASAIGGVVGQLASKGNAACPRAD